MTSLRNTVLLTLIALPMIACKGDTGAPGSNGDPGNPGTPAPTTGTLSGVVTDGVALDALPGVTVTASDSGGGALGSAITGADGAFTVTVTAGPVDLAFAKPNYTSPGVLHSGVGIGETVRLAVTMNESASGKPSVLLAAPAPGDDYGYGASVALTAVASDPNGDALTYAWKDTTDPVLDETIAGAGASATLVMPTMAAAFAPRTTSNGMKISGYPIDNHQRFGIIPILTDTRGAVSAQLVVSDGRGQSTTASLTLDAASLTSGVPAVPLGQLVYVSCGTCTTPVTWTLTQPDGTQLTLEDTSAAPAFRASLTGKYTLSAGAGSIDIYAAPYYGMIGNKGAEANSGQPDLVCTSCHGNLAGIPDRFAEYTDPLNPSVTKTGWAGTAHATTFQEGIDGALSSHFNGSCAGCHATGFDAGVANGGFADVAAQHGWKFPSTLDPNNWTNMLAEAPEVARVANIQCEACHGPQGGPGFDTTTAHATTAPQALQGIVQSQPFQSKRISYAAEACGTCHAAGSDHIYTEWATVNANDGMAHSNFADVTLGASTSLNTSCGRCHTAQGYTLYSSLLKAGKVDGTPAPIVTLTCTPASATCDPTVLPSATILGQVTATTAQPVTCAACHDPHDGTNPSQLRIYDSLAMTPAGFGVSGMGKGALCISCHNSRNGTWSKSSTQTFLHEDNDPNLPTMLSSYSAPHQADQGDVFVGRNAFFMGASLPMMSKHAAIGDTCVGCHMTLQPETFLSFGAPAKQTHLFRITDANKGTLCNNCHGPTVDGEGIQAGVEGQLATLNAKAAAALIAKIKATASGNAQVCAYTSIGGTDYYSDYNATTKKTCVTSSVQIPWGFIKSATFVEVHGQVSFDIVLNSPLTFTYYSATDGHAVPSTVTELQTQLGTIWDPALAATTTPQLFLLSGAMYKAGWNYFLVEGDQSKGLHNPTFVTQVMNSTNNALGTAPVAGL